MSNARKYLFDNDFGSPDSGHPRRPAITPEDLEAARAAAFEEGRRAAEEAAREADERRIAETLAAVHARVDALAGEQAERDGELARESASVALAICRKVMPTLAAQNALTEIEGLIVRCLADLRDEPRVVVRVADGQVEALHERIGRMTASFEGKLVLLGDDELAHTDCAVLWADGGTERNLARLWSDIDAVVSRVTDAGSAPEPVSPLDDLMTVAGSAIPQSPAGDAPADFPTDESANQECGHG